MGDIREHQKAKLYFRTEDNSEKEVICVIKEVQKDRILLDFPEEMLEYAQYLDEGSEMPVRIFTPNGISTFETIVLHSPLESDFVIEYVQDAIKIQRREYQRMAVETKMILETKNRGNIIVKTVDISGGGVRFFSEDVFYPGEQLGVLLYLPFEMISVKAQGIILEKDYLPQNQNVVLFTKIEDKERDRIIRKCFKMQVDKYRIGEDTE